MSTQQDAIHSPSTSVLPQPENLYERLLAAARNCSGKVAVSDARAALSYSEFAGLAAAFAGQLQDVGVRPGEPVGVLLGNSREFLIAAFGAWKHGAVLVPLNPQLTEAELAKYVHDCQLRGLVTASRNHPVLQTLEAKGAPIEHVWLCPLERDDWTYRGPGKNTAHGAASRSPGSRETQEWPAIIQYSTGSTGHSKRIARSHAMLVGEFTSVAQRLQTTAEDHVLGIAPFFHSHGLMNAAIQALLTGGTLHVVHGFLPRDVARLIERAGITAFPGVPFMFEQLADLRDQLDFSSLRFAISSGAPLAEKTASAFQEKYGIRIRQLYGTTETGVIAIQGGSADADIFAVGKPIAGVSVRVLDESNNPSAPDMAGRIEVTSPYAASSYAIAAGNQESYFAGSSFFPGDIGRLSPAGELALCGRHRGFINVGGSKVDPAEIETLLRELPGVAEAVVFGVPDEGGGEKVKAVLASPEGVSRMMVRTHCVRHLAEFKHPKVIEIRKELPKSPLGKILRKYLLDETASGRPGFVFDPLCGFKASAGNSAGVEDDPLQLATLPPFLRVLLVTDGTVTKSIEAYFLEPVEVDVLFHSYTSSERAYADIEVLPGDPILRRCVILRGKITRTAYAFAESVMAGNRIPPDMKRKLIEDTKGIGALLRENRKETYRELSRFKRAAAGEWAMHLNMDKSADVLQREYRIHLDGQAAMLIEEVFPVARFQSET